MGIIFDQLEELFTKAPEFLLTDNDKIVIFSDLHIGTGGSNDDFRQNSQMFLDIAKSAYLEKKFALVLNGDIEELQKFNLKDVMRHWPQVYELFDRFASGAGLYKIYGNHDERLGFEKELDHGPIYEAVKFIYKDQPIFIFHGHQASDHILKFNHIIEFLLRYFASPLNINNYSVSHDSKKKYRTEKQVYEFSFKKKIVSIIGHTHRPLFESFSKIDTLKFTIERLCREFVVADEREKKNIEESIGKYKSELHELMTKDKQMGSRSFLYNPSLAVPSIFNSGCVIGKRGMTAIEIEGGKIRLVHWFNPAISKRYYNNNGFHAETFQGLKYKKVIIKEDLLDYVFTRINLLT